MITIPVFSDTHGFSGSIEKCAQIAKKYDTFFHLGDNIRDAITIEELSGKIGLKVVGNTDIGEKGDLNIVTSIEGKNILLTHGHKYGVKRGLERLSYYCQENQIDIVLFGHTHVSLEITTHGIVFFNPGSVSLPRGTAEPSYGLLTIDDGKITTEIVPI